jgi:hypothetical protein
MSQPPPAVIRQTTPARGLEAQLLSGFWRAPVAAIHSAASLGVKNPERVMDRSVI